MRPERQDTRDTRTPDSLIIIAKFAEVLLLLHAADQRTSALPLSVWLIDCPTTVLQCFAVSVVLIGSSTRFCPVTLNIAWQQDFNLIFLFSACGLSVRVFFGDLISPFSSYYVSTLIRRCFLEIS